MPINQQGKQPAQKECAKQDTCKRKALMQRHTGKRIRTQDEPLVEIKHQTGRKEQCHAGFCKIGNLAVRILPCRFNFGGCG